MKIIKRRFGRGYSAGPYKKVTRLFGVSGKTRLRRTALVPTGTRGIDPDSTRYPMDIRFMSISCRDVHGLLEDIHRMYVYGHVWNIPKWTRLYIHMIFNPDNLNKI